MQLLSQSASDSVAGLYISVCVYININIYIYIHN